MLKQYLSIEMVKFMCLKFKNHCFEEQTDNIMKILITISDFYMSL